MSCDTGTVGCGVLNVDQQTAKIFITVGRKGCGCPNICQCGNGFNPDTTWIYIRRDGPKYSPAYGCCGNPAHRILDCPILPGDLQYPMPTFIVPCPDPVAPPFGCLNDPNNGWYYKYPPFVQYKLFSRSGNELCFFLDSIFYNAPDGRYVADLYVNGDLSGHLRIKYSKGYDIQSAKSQSFTRPACSDMNPAPACPTECN